MKINRINVLKHLYKNDDGKYLDIYKAFNINTDEKSNQINIIIQSINEYTDIRKKVDLININEQCDYSKVKINDKGRKYYEDLHHKRLSNEFSRKQIALGVASLFIAFIGFFFTNIYPKIIQVEKVIPSVVFEIKNNQDEAIEIPETVGIMLWQGNTGRLLYEGIGKINIPANTSILSVPANSVIKTSLKVINEKGLYDKYIMGDASLSLQIKPIGGRLHISDSIYFNEDSLNKYYLPIEID